MLWSRHHYQQQITWVSHRINAISSTSSLSDFECNTGYGKWEEFIEFSLVEVETEGWKELRIAASFSAQLKCGFKGHQKVPTLAAGQC